MAERMIVKQIKGKPGQDGAGVKLVRVISHGDVKEFDPFLMLDAFDSNNPADYIKGFPWHPHRGIETVTYLISGDIEHMDSLGNRGRISDGGGQWMTAGSGILHQEMPRASGNMIGYQLWINLPGKYKMTAPKYFDITSDMVTEVKKDGALVRIIGGTFDGTAGPAQGDYVKADLYDVIMQSGATLKIPTDKDKNVFVYLFEGNGEFGENGLYVSEKTAALFSQGDYITVKAGANGVRFGFFAGKPLGEPIAWGGPVVMNTHDELNKAFYELDTGTFIKHK